MKPVVYFIRSDDPLSGEALERLLDHIEEDEFVDFKRELNLNDEKTKLELVKDVSAFANGLGGYIVIGAKPLKKEYPGVDETTAQFLGDADNIMSMLNPYLDPPIKRVRSTVYPKDGIDYVILFVPMSEKVTYFISKDGSFNHLSGKVKFVLREGTFYVRRSSGNDLGNSRLIEEIFERRLEQNKRSILENVAKMVEAPAETFVLLAGEEIDASGARRYVIKDGPDALPVKGMSLTAIASSQEETVAQSISLYVNDNNDVPPESTLWMWYWDRRNLVQKLHEKQRLAVAKFSIMSNLPAFFWLQGLEENDIESMLIEVAEWAWKTGKIVSHVVDIAVFLGKNTFTKVKKKLGDQKSKLSPRRTQFPSGDPRILFYHVERLLSVSGEKHDEEELRVDAETILNNIVTISTEDKKKLSYEDKLRAISYDCYLYAQDKYVK